MGVVNFRLYNIFGRLLALYSSLFLLRLKTFLCVIFSSISLYFSLYDNNRYNEDYDFIKINRFNSISLHNLLSFFIRFYRRGTSETWSSHLGLFRETTLKIYRARYVHYRFSTLIASARTQPIRIPVHQRTKFHFSVYGTT